MFFIWNEAFIFIIFKKNIKCSRPFTALEPASLRNSNSAVRIQPSKSSAVVYLEGAFLVDLDVDTTSHLGFSTIFEELTFLPLN